MNEAMIGGHLGADPEVRFTSSGQKVTRLRVATRSSRRSSKGDDTIWWRVTIWGDQFDRMIPHLKKGSPIFVYGELSAEIFTDREGRPQISMHVTAYRLLFSPFGRPDNRSPQEVSSEPQEHVAVGAVQKDSRQEIESFNDDEIPF